MLCKSSSSWFKRCYLYRLDIKPRSSTTKEASHDARTSETDLAMKVVEKYQTRTIKQQIVTKTSFHNQICGVTEEWMSIALRRETFGCERNNDMKGSLQVLDLVGRIE